MVAPTQKIAETGFEQAADMIEAGLDIPGVETGWLKDRLHVRAHLNRIECRVTGAKLEIKTFDTKVVTGRKPVFVLVDETHELGTMATAEKVFRQLRGGQDPFPESVFIQITTQSDGRPAGVFRSELDYARSVRDGRITENVRTLPVIYELPEDVQTADDQAWRNPDMWSAVNPNVGRSTSVDKLVMGFARAEADGKAALQSWATQHLNVEAGLALHSNRWRGADYWLQNGESGLSVHDILERCDVVTAGIDGGGLDDLMALAILGRERGSRRWLHWVHAWAHPIVFELRKDIVSSLEQFRDDGDLTLIERKGQEYEDIAGWLMDVEERGLFPETQAVGIDPAQVMALLDQLAIAGLPAERLEAAPQWAAKLSPCIWGIEKKLEWGDFVHGAQPIMAWAIENAQVEQKGNAVMITKQVSGKAKIDPLAATFDAAMMMHRNPEAARQASYLDQPDAEVLIL